MKIVIVGDGKVGFSLTEQLTKEDHDIVVIDSNASVLEKALSKFDVMVVNGNGTALETQRRADVQNSDLLIAATSSDEVNLMCCMVAKKLGCKSNIARVRNRDYFSLVQFLNDELSLSMVINPEFAAAREMFRLIQFPSFLKLDSFAKGRVELVELKIKKGSKLIDVRLSDLYSTLKMQLLICAVQRNEETIIPNGKFVLKEDDIITVTAPSTELVRLVKKLEIVRQKIHNVIIIGAGRITENLTSQLLESNVKVKIIDPDKKNCLALAEKFPEAIIINNDGTKQEVLLEEGIDSTDAIIALTDIDEENFIISLFAERLGVPKTITKIDRSEYNTLFGEIGAGSIVCPKTLISHEIIRYVRAMRNSGDSSVLTLHRLVGDSVDALEFNVCGTTKNLNVKLSKLKLKQDILLACITRMGKIIIPQGDDVLTEGDTVIIIAPSESLILELNDIFVQ